MGVRSVLGADPIATAKALLADVADSDRRKDAVRRRCYYYGAPHDYIRAAVFKAYSSEVMRDKMTAYVQAGCVQGLLPRICNEIGRMLYAVPPTRKVSPESDQVAFGLLANECHLDGKLDLAARLVMACNDLLLFPRVSQTLGLRLDVLTPDMFTIVPHPDDPTVPLAVIYARDAGWVFWDDEVTIRFDDNGETGRTENTLGRLPFVAVHQVEPQGSFFNQTLGSPLVEGEDALALNTMQMLRGRKVNADKQPAFSGDQQPLAAGQVMDGEIPVELGDGSMQILDRDVPPDGFIAVDSAIAARIANDFGISLDRYQSKATQAADDTALLERRAELIGRFRPVELELFDLIKLVSREHSDPAKRMSDAATVALDFAEVSVRVDAMTQIKIDEERERRCIANVLDVIRRDQPECRTEEEAKAEYVRNLEIRAWRIQQERALNVTADATQGLAGKSPQENGAMGPAARDGTKPVQQNDDDGEPVTDADGE